MSAASPSSGQDKLQPAGRQSIEDLRPVLQCPVCRSKLEEAQACGGCGTRFLEAGGYPVLIDFADSIFTPGDYRSEAGPWVPVTKGSRIGNFLGRLTYGSSPLTDRKIDRFIELLEGRPSARVLVVGGATVGSGASRLYDGGVSFVGVDVFPSPHIALICDAHSLPFASESFDGVVIQAVLEHVVEPVRVVDEIHRVLTTDGLVYAETPFMQQVHAEAYDFTRYTASGHRWLFRRFEEVDAGTLLGPGLALLWSIAYFVRALGLGDRVAGIVTAPFFWLRLLDRLVKPGPGMDAASGFYFLGRKSSSSMKPSELPAYYDRCRS